MFSLKLFSDEISDLQAEIDKRGFKWTAGWTSLSNLTEENLKNRLGLQDDNMIYSEFPYYYGSKSTLTQKLWQTTKIKDQGNCGACWAFSSVAALETLALENGYSKDFIDLSEQFMVDVCNFSCDPEGYCECPNPGDCTFGGYLSKAANFLKNCGVPEEWCREYVAIDYVNCHSASCTNEIYMDKHFKLGSASNVEQNVDTIKSALNVGPLVAAMKVYYDFEKFYSDGVYQRVSDNLSGGHGIEVIGYQDTQPNDSFGGGYFICKNSWSTNWGSQICKHRDTNEILCGYDPRYPKEKIQCQGEKGFFCIAYDQINPTNGVDFGYQDLLYQNIIIPNHYSISGKIQNYNGYSISDADIHLKHYASHNNKWFQVRNIKPDSTGAYQFACILNWDYRVEPKKQNWCFQPQFQDITLSNDISNVNFSVNYYNVYGSAKVAITSKPVSNANIQLYGPSPGSIYTDSNGNYIFQERLCGNYTISASKLSCDFTSSPHNFNLSYSNYNVPTFYCFLKVLAKLGPLYPSNSKITVQGTATNGDQISQTKNVDSLGYCEFYLPEGSYTFAPYSECMVYNPPLLQKNVIYDENINILLNFTSSSWKICSSCYYTYFAREIECSSLIGLDKDSCLLNAKNEFKGCVIMKTNDANSYLYNAIVLSIQVHRAKGQPIEEIDYFTVEQEGDYFINITNGDNLNKDTAVSSSEVNISGIGQIFGPQDFNKNVFQLKKQIHLTVGEYQISTILRSKPDSYLTIVISNKDISSFPDLP